MTPSEALAQLEQQVEELKKVNAELQRQLDGLANGRCALCLNQKQSVSNTICEKCEKERRWADRIDRG